MPENSNAPTETAFPIRRVVLDPWVMAATTLTLLFVVIPSVWWVPQTARTFIVDYLSTDVLLIVAIGAAVTSAASRRSKRERAFWRLFAISLTAWLVGDIVSILFMEYDNAGVGVAIDAFYLLYYLGFVLALDLRPDIAGVPFGSRRLSVLSGVGRTLFVSGLFAYFVFLPRTMGITEYLSWYPSYTFYVILDAYLIARLVHAARSASTRSWTGVFALLAAASLFVLVTDSMDFAWLASYLPDELPRSLDLLWYVPMILMAGASRSRVAAKPDRRAVSAANGDERADGIPLLIYSLGFVLIHLAYSLAIPGTGSLPVFRVYLVMLWVLLFGFLHLVQNSEIDRRVQHQRDLRKIAEEHVRSLSLHDPLTNLLNRRALEAELARAVGRADRTERPLTLMFIDLDDFKTVNDTFGHGAGDRLIREAAARLAATTREVDTLARFGGDEFVLLLEALDDANDSAIVACRILEGFAAGFHFEDQEIELTVSIGIAVQPKNGRTPLKLIEAADRAMYRVKQEGGAGFRFA